MKSCIPNTEFTQEFENKFKKIIFGVLFFTALYASEAMTIRESNSDPIKEHLLKEVSDILDETRKAIDTLAKTGKETLRNGLTKAIAIAKELDTKVKALKPETDLGK
ncbi:unnamed protein product, partial [Medioppia subpectinata]